MDISALDSSLRHFGELALFLRARLGFDQGCDAKCECESVTVTAKLESEVLDSANANKSVLGHTFCSGNFTG